MQQNQFEHTETPYVSAPTLETVSTSCSLPDPVEAHLEELLTPLKQSLPVEQIVEMRKEWRGHLEDIVAANIELGSSPEEALEQARRQFGRSRMISRRYKQAWEQSHGKETMKHSRKVACLCFAGLIQIIAILLFVTGQRLNSSMLGGDLAMILFLKLPLFMGFLTGQFTRGKEVRAWLQAIIILCPVLLGVYVVWAHMQKFDEWTFAGLLFFTPQYYGIAIFGTLGAWVGGRVRNVAKRVHRQFAR